MKTRNVSILFVLLGMVCLTAGSASAISKWQTGTSYEDLIAGGNATASSVNYSPSTDPGISGAYLLAFHVCDPEVSDCSDPRNHNVYLAQSDDGANWSVVPGWETYKGSVPDVIRRGETLYVYTPGKVRRYDFATETWKLPVRVELTDTESDSFVDPSLIIDDQDRLVLFYLAGIIGQDPAGCAPGETSCVKHFRSATEVEGSDGTQFVADSGDRVQVTIIPPSTAADPDIFYDGNRYVTYIARGQTIQVYTSQTLLGDYTLLSTLPDGYLTHVVGVGSGYFDQATSRYWTYGHTFEGIIRRAVHASLDEFLSDSDFTTVLTGSSIGLGASSWVTSPGFTANTTGKTADISVHKTVDKPKPNVGDNVIFTITVTNNGPNDAMGVQVTDQLPAGLAYVADDSGGAYAPGTGIWDVGDLGNGESSALEITATVDQAGRFTNTAIQTESNPPDPNPENDSDDASVNTGGIAMPWIPLLLLMPGD